MRKFLKYFILILFFIAIIFSILINNWTKKGLPKINGEILIPELNSEVKILRDKYGVPHIFAKNLDDLFYAVGFVHAQDRLWQMDLFRRIANGRMTEVFGNVKISQGGRENLDLLSQDKFYRIVGFKNYAEKSVENISEDTKLILNKYCEGVNDYIKLNKNNLPLEFSLLGYKPERWEPSDTLALGMFLAWELTSNWETELLRYLTVLKIGKEKLSELFPKIDSPGPYIVENPKEIYLKNKITETPYKDFSINPDFAKKILSLVDNIKKIYPASNNWVVSGKKSRSGKPILCNDPHLTHLLPSIFYQIHLVCNDLNVIGVSFPGLPFVVLGHNKNFAWAATTTNADTSDLFVERINPTNPNQYLYKNKYKNFEKRLEKIYVKKGKKKQLVEFEVLTSCHGPIINSIYPEFLKDSFPIALSWTGFYSKNHGAIYSKFARAKDIKDFISAVKLNEIPIQNWVFADTEGNIGYFPGGLIPVRKNGDGTFPVEGWTGKYDWIGFIPYDEIPQVYNPEENYIVTANNKVISPEKYKYIISYDYPPSYRATRIVELLKSKDQLTISDMKKFQKDNYSKQGERIAKYFVKVCEKAERKERIYQDACKFLKNWNFHTDVNSIGATIFYKMYDIALKNTLEDELGKDLLEMYLNNIRIENIFDRLLEMKNSVFFDNITTSEIENKEEILAKSFISAVDFLKKDLGEDISKWRWGEIHTITFSHPFASKKILKPFFSYGPFEIQGGRHIVDLAFYNLGKDHYNTEHGAAYRMVIDMADVENAQMIIDTGQSGHFRSKHFLDQVNLWLRGEMVPMLMDEEDIKKNLESELILKPVR